jgi:hypothetical protein
MKMLDIVRTICFVLVLLTSIPLFINYLKGVEPQFAIVTHLHVWLGVIFFVVAIISMVKKKKGN